MKHTETLSAILTSYKGLLRPGATPDYQRQVEAKIEAITAAIADMERMEWIETNARDIELARATNYDEGHSVIATRDAIDAEMLANQPQNPVLGQQSKE